MAHSIFTQTIFIAYVVMYIFAVAAEKFQQYTVSLATEDGGDPSGKSTCSVVRLFL